MTFTPRALSAALRSTSKSFFASRNVAGFIFQLATRMVFMGGLYHFFFRFQRADACLLLPLARVAVLSCRGPCSNPPVGGESRRRETLTPERPFIARARGGICSPRTQP